MPAKTPAEGKKIRTGLALAASEGGRQGEPQTALIGGSTIHVEMDTIISKIWPPAPENEAQLRKSGRIRDSEQRQEANVAGVDPGRDRCSQSGVAEKVEAERRARAVG
jgi:hypothetical protein